MQPAVSPEAAKHAHDEYFSDSDSHLPAWQRRPATGSGRSSRRTSRPTSAQFHHHEFHSTGTPLNEIEEYEPLFKDEDEAEMKRPLTAADKLKRPELDRRRFPSQVSPMPSKLILLSSHYHCTADLHSLRICLHVLSSRCC